MSQACPRQPRWQIRRTFEVNRLAQVYLNEAYEKIVPIHVRVVSRQGWEHLAQSSRMTPATGRERRMA